MIKYWQSMQDYKYFLTESKAHFDSSERNRLHTELWKIWQKLWLFDTDRAMEFLLPFYSATGRPARNQPQILRSFILFFFLYSEGLAKPSLTLWADRLKDDRVLASLIGCTQDSLPPLSPQHQIIRPHEILFHKDGKALILCHFRCLPRPAFLQRPHTLPAAFLPVKAELFIVIVTAVEETLQLITAAAKLRIIALVCRNVSLRPSVPRFRKLCVKQFLQCLCRFLP